MRDVVSVSLSSRLRENLTCMDFDLPDEDVQWNSPAVLLRELLATRRELSLLKAAAAQGDLSVIREAGNLILTTGRVTSAKSVEAVDRGGLEICMCRIRFAM